MQRFKQSLAGYFGKKKNRNIIEDFNILQQNISQKQVNFIEWRSHLRRLTRICCLVGVKECKKTVKAKLTNICIGLFYIYIYIVFHVYMYNILFPDIANMRNFGSSQKHMLYLVIGCNRFCNSINRIQVSKDQFRIVARVQKVYTGNIDHVSFKVLLYLREKWFLRSSHITYHLTQKAMSASHGISM